MTCRPWYPASVSRLTGLLARFLEAAGMLPLLAGFSETEVEFDSADVPPSEFEIWLAKQKGLPAPEGVPGRPAKAPLTRPEG